MHIGLVSNPHSLQNLKDPGRLDRLRKALGTHGTIVTTQKLDDLSGAVQQLREDGCDLWLSDGGDGSFHHLLNSLAASGDISPETILPTATPLAGGSVNGVFGCTDLPARADRAVAMIAAGRFAQRKELATLHAEILFPDGKRLAKVCFSAVLGGIGENYFSHYYDNKRRGVLTGVQIIARGLGSAARITGDSGDFFHSLLKPSRVDVFLDGEKLTGTEFHVLNASSLFFRLGGVFRLFPLAKPGAPQFQVGRWTSGELIKNIPNLLSGSPLAGNGIHDCNGTSLRIKAKPDATIDPMLDGEFYRGAHSIHITPGPMLPIPSPS